MPATGNILFHTMTPEDRERLEPALEAVPLERRQVVERAQAPIRHAWFPDSGVLSVVAFTSRGRRIEAGLMGRDGMSGLALLLGADRSPNETLVQVAGAGHRLPAEALLAALDESPTLHAHLLRFVQALLVQTSQTALANGQARLEERLARWLLMCHDRAEGDVLALTHDFLALMLGVRRAGVTVALHALEARGLIAARRGGCTVLDREGLEALANGIYGIPGAEFRRLFGLSPGGD